jgi:hypothetical protein
MRLVRLLRDFLLVHRRAVAGMCILITAAVVSPSLPADGGLIAISPVAERDSLCDISALLILHSDQHLSSIVVRRSCGMVRSQGLRSAAALLAAALIAFGLPAIFPG